jgi:NAD-dependent SIR2 family protein deacetylase
MSMIAITGYKMPKDCVNCVMQMGGWCGVSPPEVDERVAETVEDAINNGKPDWCPLVEIDAEPVRHGEWIIKPHGSYGQLRAFCSACGKHSGIGGIESNQRKPFCPNCGARMDGGAE